jgi:DNA-binding NarL/FixJ family response regulator
VQSEPAELVIMDVGLPGIDGFEAVRQIRLTNATICIVMLSFDDGTRYRAEAAAVGANAYVSKRRIHSDLLPAVRGLLGEPTSAKDAATDGPG